ncbi:MAG: glycosyltransferase [Acidimicrobiia bacterium]|nr:glycosyltransferase [Acidimicrobiia bacterium]MDH5236192.1 glycosyltransferase [Acidimicrobiia bacterium]
MASRTTPATMMLVPDLPVADEWVRAAARHQLVVPVRVRPGPLTRHLPRWDGDGPITVTRPRLRARRFRPQTSLRLEAQVLTRVVDHLAAQGIDITVAHGHFAAASRGLPGLRARRDIPYVVSEHSSALTFDNPHKQVSGSGRVAARTVYAAAERVLPVSDALGRALVQRRLVSEDRLTVLGNPVDTDRFHPPETPPTSPRIITVARLVGVKRLDLLIDAFAEVGRRRPDTIFDIVGDGPERGPLERRVARHRLEPQVRFHGRLDRDQVATALRSARVFALSSFTENLPVAVLEAMATGLPVVAPAVGGIPELLDTTRGDAVAPGDADALAIALIRWLDADGDSRDTARRVAIERHSVTAIGDLLSSIYDLAASRQSSLTLTPSSKG